MSRAPMPKDCYDVETAAHFLAMSTVELYKFLRGKNWLFSKKFTGDKSHNLPRPWTVKAGYLTTQVRGYAAPFNPNIELTYRAALLTRYGLERIASLMNKTIELPTPAALSLENALKVQAQTSSTTVQEEREKAINELRAMGLYMDKTG